MWSNTTSFSYAITRYICIIMCTGRGTRNILCLWRCNRKFIPCTANERESQGLDLIMQQLLYGSTQLLLLLMRLELTTYYIMHLFYPLFYSFIPKIDLTTYWCSIWMIDFHLPCTSLDAKVPNRCGYWKDRMIQY